MDVPSVLAFIAENHRAVLATRRADGRPQLSPVAVGVDEQARVVISTRETAMKTRNLRRDPFASICVLNDGFFGRFVQVEGPVEVVGLPGALDGLVSLYRSVAGEHGDWDEFRAAMVREQRVLLRMTVARAGPTVSG